MSWKWLVDVRGERTKVDWSRLLIVLIACELVLGPIIWYVFQNSIVLGIAGSVLAATLLIAWDVIWRRR